jgi:hypothetical protein
MRERGVALVTGPSPTMGERGVALVAGACPTVGERGAVRLLPMVALHDRVGHELGGQALHFLRGELTLQEVEIGRLHLAHAGDAQALYLGAQALPPQVRHARGRADNDTV